MFLLHVLYFDSRADTRNAGMASRQRGNVSLFGIGLGLMILAVGGLSMDLWQIISTRKALAEVADAAAAAGANQIDFAEYRERGDYNGQPGTFRVNPAESVDVGYAAGRDQPEWGVVDNLTVDFTHDVSGVVVVATGTVDFTLLGIISGTDDFQMQVTSRASPRRTLTP